MLKPNKHPNETEDETFEAFLENSTEYVKYIKKLELQRSVLTKIIKGDLNTMNETSAIDPNISESV
ncbi:MAG: hypothetical protein WCM93_12465 [Bacteroidota bacterium]